MIFGVGHKIFKFERNRKGEKKTKMAIPQNPWKTMMFDLRQESSISIQRHRRRQQTAKS